VAIEVGLQARIGLLFVDEGSSYFLFQSTKLLQCRYSTPSLIVDSELTEFHSAVTGILIAFLIAFPFRRDSSIVFTADVAELLS
jgi:hypothetical protein